jgi:hypothetical protein
MLIDRYELEEFFVRVPELAKQAKVTQARQRIDSTCVPSGATALTRGGRRLLAVFQCLFDEIDDGEGPGRGRERIAWCPSSPWGTTGLPLDLQHYIVTRKSSSSMLQISRAARAFRFGFPSSESRQRADFGM